MIWRTLMCSAFRGKARWISCVQLSLFFCQHEFLTVRWVNTNLWKWSIGSVITYFQAAWCCSSQWTLAHWDWFLALLLWGGCLYPSLHSYQCLHGSGGSCHAPILAGLPTWASFSSLDWCTQARLKLPNKNPKMIMEVHYRVPSWRLAAASKGCCASGGSHCLSTGVL